MKLDGKTDLPLYVDLNSFKMNYSKKVKVLISVPL